MGNEKRGRPQGALAHTMDATAQALELPPWDYRETALMCQMMVYTDQLEQLAEGILKVTAKAETLLHTWVNGDDIENQCHMGVLEHLREANRLMDGYKENCPMGQASDSQEKADESLPTPILAE